MAYLRTVPAADILKAMDGIRAAGLMLDVNWDGQLLPSFPPEVYRQGKELAIPLMIGNNGQEMPLAGGGRGRAPVSGNMTELLTSAVGNFYGKYPDLLSRASSVYGLDGSGQVSTYPPWGDAGSQFRADTSFRCEAVALAAWHSKVAPVYEFEFAGGTAAHPPSHSSELKYVFGLLDDQAADPAARRLSEAMQQYWVNFAKTGNPNGVGLPEWPKFDGANKRYLELSMEGPLPKAALRNQACTIYSDKLNRDLDELSQAAPR